MADVIHAMRSPFSREYVKMTVPSSLTIAKLEESARLAKRIATDVVGGEGIPSMFKTFPINMVGHTALMLVANTMPSRLADSKEGIILINMITAFSFIRQLLDRVSSGVRMDRIVYINSIVSFCERYTMFFVDAVKMRLIELLRQSLEEKPPSPEKSQRLSRLAQIAFKTFDDLEGIMGSEAYSAWLDKTNVKNYSSPNQPPSEAMYGSEEKEERDVEEKAPTKEAKKEEDEEEKESEPEVEDEDEDEEEYDVVSEPEIEDEEETEDEEDK